MLLAFDGRANATCRTYRRVGIATRSTWTWWLRDAGFVPALHQHSQQTTPLQHFAGARVMSQQRFPAQVATAASSFYTPPAFQFNPGYATLWRRFR